MKVEVRKDEAGWWIATSRAVPGMVTQARRLDQIAERAREAAAVMLDVPLDDVDVELVTTPDSDAVVRYLAASERADEAQAELGVASRAAARELVGAGLSLRDAATVLGVSHQRVGQLVGASRGSARKAPAKAAAKKAPARVTKKSAAKKPAADVPKKAKKAKKAGVAKRRLPPMKKNATKKRVRA